MESGTVSDPLDKIYGNAAADFGDFDRDAKLDLIVTRFGNQSASLFWNRREESIDIADKALIARPTLAPIKCGVGFGDFDNDGWPDILVANGHFSASMDALPGEAR